MSRVDRFRQYRYIRRKIAASFILFVLLMITGIFVADYSVNSILRNEKKINIVSIKAVKGNFIEISLMNQRIYINTRYINRDLKRIKELFGDTSKKG